MLGVVSNITFIFGLKGIESMAKIYDRKRIQRKAANGKGRLDDVQRKPGTNFQEPSPSRATRELFIPPATDCEGRCECCPPGKPVRVFLEEMRISVLCPFLN